MTKPGVDHAQIEVSLNLPQAEATHAPLQSEIALDSAQIKIALDPTQIETTPAPAQAEA